jgi:aldehyde:ferredoxin oxidoreductase
LGSGTVKEESIEDILSSYIGGRGVATKLAHDRIPFDADPLGPDNRLVFTTGPLQHAQMSFTGRMNLTGLSPLTNGLLSSNAGGYLSRNFTGTGYSAVEIRGQADELTALHIKPDGVEFEAVPELAGAEVPAVTTAMKDRHGLESEHLATVGPAGENQVRFASVMTYDSRAFGRGGLGAALGTKNIKCISFRGSATRTVELPEDPQQEVHRAAATSDDIMRRQGTTGGTEFINDNFSLPTRYFSEMSFDDAAAIGGDAVEKKKYKKGACSVCAFACKLPTKDKASGVETEGPEFETVMSFGSNAEIGDLVAIMQSNDLCDRYGMDTISCGNVVSAYLDATDEFGNVELVHDLIEQIAHRDGVGDTLAEGINRFHDELDVENWTVKGLDFAAHDGRVLYGQGLSYAVANRGADHLYSATMLSKEYGGAVDPETLDDKAEILVTDENRAAIRDSGVICDFAGDRLTKEHHEQLLGAPFEDLLAVGRRVVDLERHFNNRRGFDRADDRLPYDLPGFEAALDEYYDLRGWTPEGVVPDDRISELATV